MVQLEGELQAAAEKAAAEEAQATRARQAKEQTLRARQSQLKAKLDRERARAKEIAASLRIQAECSPPTQQRRGTKPVGSKDNNASVGDSEQHGLEKGLSDCWDSCVLT